MSSAPDGPGRRRKGAEKNANYLLQFSSSVPTREAGSEATRRANRAYRNNSIRQTFDRLEFLHANFRFGVSKRWKSHHNLDWDDIILLEMAHVATEECPRMRCPISLDDIELPYMTPCGHVFSLVSIMTDMLVKYDGEIRGTSPCPLCGVDVRARDLRPVEIRYIRECSMVGSSVEFSLVWREKSSLAVHDVHGDGRFEGFSQQSGGGHYPVSMPRFSRIMLVENPIDLWRYVVTSLAERADVVRMEGGQEAEYYYPGYLAAIETVKEHCKYMCSRDENDGDGSAAMVARLQEAVDAVCCMSRERETRDQIEQEFPSLTISDNADKNKSGVDDCVFDVCRCTDPLDEVTGADEKMYMYQIADGRWIFMSLLNMKMLHSWKQSYDTLPESITVHIVDVEMFEQTVESRKRYKPFSHVPLSARVLLCEVDLSGVLPAEILSLYDEELSKRRAKREALAKQQARRERLERKKASVEKSVPVSIMMANMPRLRHEDSDEDFDEFVDQTTYESPTGVSFAKIAEMGFAATGPDLSGSSPTQATGSSPPVWVQKKHPYEAAFQDLPPKPSSTSGGKKKGSKQVLFMSSSQRQY